MVTRTKENFNRNILNHLETDMKKEKHNRERSDKNINHGFNCQDEVMKVMETEERHLDFAIA